VTKPGSKQSHVDKSLRSNPDAIAAFLNLQFVGAGTDKIGKALQEALRAQNVSELARNHGINRTQVYSSFRKGITLKLATMLRFLDALGLELRVERKKSSRVKRPASR